MKRLSLFLACLLGAMPAWGAEPAPQKTRLAAEFTEMKTVGNETHVICTRSKDAPVTLTGTDLKIVCDRLEIIALGRPDEKSTVPILERFKYLLATGGVNIVQGDREAICGRAEVFPLENKIELTEKPVIKDHGTDWTGSGSKITMFRGERRVRIEQTELEGPPIKHLGFDPKQPAPTPNAAPEGTAPPASTPPK